jgi:hypothetical protein
LYTAGEAYRNFGSLIATSQTFKATVAISSIMPAVPYCFDEMGPTNPSHESRAIITYGMTILKSKIRDFGVLRSLSINLTAMT